MFKERFSELWNLQEILRKFLIILELFGWTHSSDFFGTWLRFQDISWGTDFQVYILRNSREFLHSNQDSIFFSLKFLPQVPQNFQKSSQFWVLILRKFFRSSLQTRRCAEKPQKKQSFFKERMMDILIRMWNGHVHLWMEDLLKLRLQ